MIVHQCVVSSTIMKEKLNKNCSMWHNVILFTINIIKVFEFSSLTTDRLSLTIHTDNENIYFDSCVLKWIWWFTYRPMNINLCT